MESATKKAPTSKITTTKKTAKNKEVSIDAIRERAYQIYLETDGNERENWVRAEKELMGKKK